MNSIPKSEIKNFRDCLKTLGKELIGKINFEPPSPHPKKNTCNYNFLRRIIVKTTINMNFCSLFSMKPVFVFLGFFQGSNSYLAVQFQIAQPVVEAENMEAPCFSD